MNKKKSCEVRKLLNEAIEECNVTIQEIRQKYESELELARNKKELRIVQKKIEEESRIILYAKQLLCKIRFLWRIFPFTCIDGYRAAKSLEYGLVRSDFFDDRKTYLKCREVVYYYVDEYEEKSGFLYYASWIIFGLVIISTIIIILGVYMCIYLE